MFVLNPIPAAGRIALTLVVLTLGGCDLLLSDGTEGSGALPSEDTGQGGGESDANGVPDSGFSDSGGGGGGSDASTRPPAIDPDPDATESGANPQCAAAPTVADVPVRDTISDATTWSVAGTVLNHAGKAKWYLESATGQTAGGALGVSNDAFQLTVPLFCGEQTLKLYFENADCATTWIVALNRLDCVEPALRATIAWDDLGRDWELHLIRPGGRINDNASDCTWTSCIGVRPDWGVQGDASDDPEKDIDDVTEYGPENIYLNALEEGRYHVMVEHWGNGSPDSEGELILQLGGTTYRQTYSGLAPQEVWLAATLDWPSGVVTFSNTVYDCSGSWDGGCTAQLPAP